VRGISTEIFCCLVRNLLGIDLAECGGESCLDDTKNLFILDRRLDPLRLIRRCKSQLHIHLVRHGFEIESPHFPFMRGVEFIRCRRPKDLSRSSFS
jgi:hypothetical protein